MKEPKPENKQVLKDFFNHPNDEMTWGEVLENVPTDFEALGNGYFEVVRNRFGGGPAHGDLPHPRRHDASPQGQEGLHPARRQPDGLLPQLRERSEGRDSFDPRDKHKPPEKRLLLNEVIHLKNYHPRSAIQITFENDIRPQHV